MADVSLLTDVYAALRVTLYREGCGALLLLPAPLPWTRRLEKTAKFIIYKDFDGRYRWRLRSGEGATMASSEGGHHEKSWCAQEMEHWKLEYPDVPVRDATFWSFDE
jgi:uncharacterized protein YegP (UPF0339 family)